ncbi:ATP-binding protein [Winogradskyella litorisediminis]|uniref:histidine kinase n=1 Tax=Winogradskyella litorisediminis TaxID=1156618 RepID=A0ABW3N376_9FLAO
MKTFLFYIVFIGLSTSIGGAQTIVDYSTLLDSASYYIRNNKSEKGKQILDFLKKETENNKKDSLNMIVLERFAFYHFLEGNYDESVKYAYDASTIAKSLGYRKMYFDLQNNIGAIFSKLDEYEKAKKTYKEILKESSIKEDTVGYISTLSNLGSSYSTLKQIDSSNVALAKALQLSRISKLVELEAAILKFMAKNNLDLKNYKGTIEIINILEDSLWNNLRENQKDDAIYYKAKANFELGNFSRALNEIEKALALSSVQKQDPAILDALNLKSQIFEKQNNYKLALDVQRQVTKLKDSFDLERRKEKILELERKYETEKKEKANAELKAEAFNKDLTISKKNNLILLLFIITASIIVLMVLWQLYRFKNKNYKLKVLIEQTVKLQKELDIIRDNIAKDFHDDLGNKLARITTLSDYVLKKNKEKNKTDMLDAFQIIKRDANDLYNGTRDFMFSLKSDSDAAESTFFYLADFTQEYVSSFDIELELNHNLEEEKLLPKYWNRQIILIFKEAITNAVKHSHAKKIELSFYCRENVLLVKCVDNGRGFDITKVNKINGISHMKQRARKIGCSISVESETKKGTTVVLEGEILNYNYLRNSL